MNCQLGLLNYYQSIPNNPRMTKSKPKTGYRSPAAAAKNHDIIRPKYAT